MRRRKSRSFSYATLVIMAEKSRQDHIVIAAEMYDPVGYKPGFKAGHFNPPVVWYASSNGYGFKSHDSDKVLFVDFDIIKPRFAFLDEKTHKSVHLHMMKQVYYTLRLFAQKDLVAQQMFPKGVLLIICIHLKKEIQQSTWKPSRCLLIGGEIMLLD